MQVYSAITLFSIRVEVIEINQDFYQWQVVELGTEKVCYRHKEHRYSNPAVAMRDCLFVICGEPDEYRKRELQGAINEYSKLNFLSQPKNKGK